MSIVLNAVRSQFPALKSPAVFLDNPGGTQVARTCLERIEEYLLQTNANSGGVFATSIASDAAVEKAREAVADFFNAPSPRQIIFGANMTTLTFSFSRALGRRFKAGDTIVLTRMDHDGNISPWLMLAEDRDLKIRFVDFKPETGMLDMDDLRAALAEKPAMVAFGYASNALGTINPAAEIVRLAHEAGALTYIDAVQYAPHGPIDVQALDTDFLVCSSYKFYGPHAGILYGREELLNSLTAYKVRPCSNELPDKFETGTGNFEHMAGIFGTLEYFEWLGQTFGEEFHDELAKQYSGRRLDFKKAMHAIAEYDHELNVALLNELRSVPGVTVYGITDESQFAHRVPTFSFTVEGHTPKDVATEMAKRDIYLWKGNFYALEVAKRCGVQEKGGFVRVGATHYNTIEEIKQFGAALKEIAAAK